MVISESGMYRRMVDRSIFDGSDGNTPLYPDDRAGLIPDLHTRGELNEFEQMNITAAALWAPRSTKLKKELLTVAGLQLLHKRMFDQTWRWAGQFRLSDTNIGVPWAQVSTQLAQLCGNTKYQADESVFPLTELAVRFHHKLVQIHPFPNGNGRHARLSADLLLRFHKQSQLSWGGQSSQTPAPPDTIT